MASVKIEVQYITASVKEVELPEGYTMADLDSAKVVFNQGLVKFKDGTELPFTTDEGFDLTDYKYPNKVLATEDDYETVLEL